MLEVDQKILMNIAKERDLPNVKSIPYGIRINEKAFYDCMPAYEIIMSLPGEPYRDSRGRKI